MSEYPDSRLCLPVFVCFRLCPPVMTGPPVITGWLRMHGAAHREPPPPHTKSVLRDTLDSMGDVNHAHEGTSKNFPYFEY